jgi:ubiquinone/menaquinone biosynthesis C-methylase UbiE
VEVIAVEPSAGMRARLAANLPTVTLLAGSAEAIPLPDGSVNAVFVAQAWHWVNPARAVPEIARVVRPRGRLGLLYTSPAATAPNSGRGHHKITEWMASTRPWYR